MIDNKISDHAGPQELLAYIREHHGTVPAFAATAKIDRYKLEKVLKGQIQRIDVEFAFAVQRATDGAVPASRWLK